MNDIVEQLREWAKHKLALGHDEAGRHKLDFAITEIVRLRAERDALLNLCVAEDPDPEHMFATLRYAAFAGWHPREWWTPTASYIRTRAEGDAAVRRAAGLDTEAAS